MSCPVGVTISHPWPPVLIEALTVTLAAVALEIEMVCGSGGVVPVWNAKLKAEGLTFTVGAAATVKLTGKLTGPARIPLAPRGRRACR